MSWVGVGCVIGFGGAEDDEMRVVGTGSSSGSDAQMAVTGLVGVGVAAGVGVVRLESASSL